VLLCLFDLYFLASLNSRESCCCYCFLLSMLSFMVFTFPMLLLSNLLLYICNRNFRSLGGIGSFLSF